MNQIFNAIAIAAITLCIGCLGIPTNLETPIGFENSTEVTLSENENDNLINTKTKKLSNTAESPPVMQIKVLETPKDEKIEQNAKTMENKSNVEENHKKEEADYKFKVFLKDVTAEEIAKQSEPWKHFEDDFSLLKDRLPDLTEEQYIELNNEDAIPWNFLKSLDVKIDINEDKPKEIPLHTPIYITVPIVINTHSTLPVSVTIGGQSVPLTLTGDIKDPSVMKVTPTPNYNKLKDYAEPPPRQTNRHRSNVLSKIQALNNKHKIQEF